MIEGLAYPLPVIVIAEILSLPPADRALFKRWSDDVIAVAAGVGNDHERRERALRSAHALAEYFAALVTELKVHPNDTLLSGLVEAEEEGARLTGEELLANAILLLMNGHETTTFAIGNGMLALLRHGDELARLRNDSRLIGSAVEEILRYDGSVQMRGVSAGDDFVIDRAEIRAGDTLWLAIGATGRDPRQFPEPNRLDIGNSPNRHLQFGIGPHFCIGAALAARGDPTRARRPARPLPPDRACRRRHPLARDRRLPRPESGAPRARPLDQQRISANLDVVCAPPSSAH